MTNRPSVYFGSVQHGNRGAFASFAAKVDEVFRRLDLSTIEKRDKVAVKMHLGNDDGYQTVPVFFVRRIVQAIKNQGAYPFITDTATSVYNAASRGYTEETCGCPLVPATGIKDGYTYETAVKIGNIESLDMAGVLHDSDVLVDLSHVKGHNSCGFGGAIKNISLGGYSARSRWERYHRVHESIPYWDSDKCTPEHAKRLVQSCPDRCIKYDEKSHRLTVSFDMCNQCMECVRADEGVGCLRIRKENFSLFQELMAKGAKAILDCYDKNKVFFLSFLTEMTAYCDCWGIGQPVVINDIGVLSSRDIVAIETAALDLIAKEGLIERNIPPFIRADLDPSHALHPFARLHGPMKDPYIVVEYAERLGLGSRLYDLIEVLSPAETMSMKAPSGVSERAPSFY
ncbi:MAG: DUF362 domain-containing protein [Candidatus Thorarchaeota archaeon]|nr:DUF362 domain-containing protein [Candidatus Thorarchaeota archaeon]